MLQPDSSQIIKDGWYFFIDIVGSTDPNLSIFCQLDKIKEIKRIISQYLKIKENPEIYKSFTGDGMLIVFLDYSNALDLAIFVHKSIKEYNKRIKDKEFISVRIGIGFGSFLSFNDGVNEEFAPWGHELILARRIMDIANPNQILITDYAFQKIKNDFFFDKNQYGINMFDKGKIILKHHEELENVYSFYKENEYGNNSEIEINLEIKPLIMSYKFDKNFINPIQNFCEGRFETIISKFKELIDPSKGLEVGLLSTGLIYKVLFENGSDYISATYLSPGEYWDIQNSDPLNLLSYHEKALKRIHKTNSRKNYRFLIMEKERLEKDIKINQNSSLLFIKWHSENNVNIINVEPSSINDILNKYPKIVHNVGLGLWYEKYVLQFGPIMEYTNSKDLHHPIKRRRFWLHSFNSETYIQTIQFFDELIKLSEIGKLTKIDHNYFNKIISEA